MATESGIHSTRSGATLIELMVALSLGLLLVLGAIVIHQRSHTTLRTVDAVARLQEVARLALDVIETDVRMASHWGFVSRADAIVNRAGPGDALPAPFTVLQGARIDLCGGAGTRWAIDLDAYVDGSNDGYGFSCAAVGGARPLADTLLVRRAADSQPTALEANRIYLQTSHLDGRLFVPSPACTDPAQAACLPTGYLPTTSRSRALVVHAYYVSSRSTSRPDVPALRRKSFGNVNAAIAADAITDEEIVAGVEDLQVRFGVDLDADGSVDDYVNPGALPSGASVVAVTIWLRVRSEDREPGHVDGAVYEYDGMGTPYAPHDHYRRVVMARTLQLRNARP